MGKLGVSRSGASCFVFLLLVLSRKVAGRVHYDAAAAHQLLLSDGTSVISDHEEDSFLHDHLKGMGMGMDSSEGNSCHQMYGFLPCSTNLPGHIFLIVIYEFLLYCGESYVSRDARDLLFGKGYWGAVLFQLLDSLPEPLVLAASVALSNNEAADEHLAMAVGLLVGSSILLLTVVWGFCTIFGRRKFDYERSKNDHWLRRLLTGSGVVTDSETSLRARFMLVSLMPFIVLLIPMAYGVSFDDQKSVLASSLLVALLCLVYYFFAQHADDSIQKRTLEYAEIERKIEMRVPFYEVQVLMLNRNKHLMRMGIEMEKRLGIEVEKMEIEMKKMVGMGMGMEMEKMVGMGMEMEKKMGMEMEKKMGTKEHKMIGKDGVLVRFKEWFFQKIQLMEDPNSHTKFNQVAQLLLEEKISLIKLISGMVRHDLLNNLDEAQRKLAINRIFEEMDRDGSSSIDPSELKHFLETEQKDKPVNEEVVEMIMAHLDVDGNGNIDRKEFDNGLAEWAWEIEQHNSRNHDADKNRRDEEAKGRRDGKSKAIGFVGIGMLMLGFFAEPLTHSVQIFSESISILPFYISFVFLPVATQARTAFAAFGAAKQKRHHTTSSTFSEMYHKVTMNNLMGFALLLCVMIYRELTWHFSAEVLTLVIVCGIVGILTGFNSKFPNWTLIIAFPLYPLSLIFFSHINFYFQ
ncbi:sodium/calcium exchanger NCL1-like [Cynara cardunculus var. scolymus]|uniref:sodium/calcium exchanger NCL1-like n=1 Tax=Cynara cardunculus var. scolymus TaxID=59895 RepID=UPI000D626620|nr:sodium/calcium exchanger NCL1-like [Cynara cardunculus var. scolymus]